MVKTACPGFSPPGYTPPAIDEYAPDLPWDFCAASRTGRYPSAGAAKSDCTKQAPEPVENAKTDAPLLAPQLSQQENRCSSATNEREPERGATQFGISEESQTQSHTDRPGIQGEFVR